MSDLKFLISKLNKKFGEGSVVLAKDFKHQEVGRLSSGSLFLDKCLGRNASKVSGWPLGRIVELYGPQMAGKSTLALKTISEAQKKGMTCAYFDCEKSFDKDRAKVLGVNIDELLVSVEAIGEKVLEAIAELLKTKEVGVIVVDSLASMVPQAEMDKSLEDSNRMALVAQMMSQGLRKLTALNDDTLIIFINQLREKPGVVYGNPSYTPGGKALGFYASVRVELRAGDWILEDKRKIGNVVKFNITKNKTATPHQTGYYKFLYSGEIDKADELISIGLLNATIKQKGAYFYIDEEAFRGREELEEGLKKDAILFEKVRKVVFENDGAAFAADAENEVEEIA